MKRLWFLFCLTFAIATVVELTEQRSLEPFNGDGDVLLSSFLLAFLVHELLEYVVNYTRRPG